MFAWISTPDIGPSGVGWMSRLSVNVAPTNTIPTHTLRTYVRASAPKTARAPTMWSGVRRRHATSASAEMPRTR